MQNWVEPSSQGKAFLKKGYCTTKLDSGAGGSLDKVRKLLVAGLRANMAGGAGLDEATYLNTFHKFADLSKLNDVRVKVHKTVCASEEFKKLVFDSVKTDLFELIGNEIVMQRAVNFVAHMPKDPDALLYLHTDVWAGCSPYEVILWLPLVDVYGTKSMYIVDKDKNDKYLRELKAGLRLKSAAELMEHVRPDTQPLELKYGEALLFSPTLIHGAVENKTEETRFILNVRFKSLFSPYGTKSLGETFAPVNYRPVTEIGLSYEQEYGTVTA